MSCAGENMFHPGLSEVRCAPAGGAMTPQQAAITTAAFALLRITTPQSKSLRASPYVPYVKPYVKPHAKPHAKPYVKTFYTRGSAKEKSPSDPAPGPIRGKNGEELSRHARRRLRRVRRRRRIHRLAALGLRC